MATAYKQKKKSWKWHEMTAFKIISLYWKKKEDKLFSFFFFYFKPKRERQGGRGGGGRETRTLGH